MRAEARHRHILDCAKKVFAQRGYHAANVSHICHEAGIGRGTLYLYFQNKRAVFEAILRETLDRVRNLLRREQPRRWPSPERLTRADAVRWTAGRMRAILGTVFEDQQTLRIVLREAVGLDVDIEHILGEIDEGLIRMVAEDMAAAQRAGFVRELDPRVAATLMVGGVEKLAMNALRSDSPVDLDALALEAARFHASGALSDRLRPDSAPPSTRQPGSDDGTHQ